MPTSAQVPPIQPTSARGSCATSVCPRVPNASTSRPSSPARRLCASRARWTTQSPGRTSKAVPSSRQIPDPPRTKKTSSAAVWRWKGVDHLPGSSSIRLTPTVCVPAATPRLVHSPPRWPASRRTPSVSSQWAITGRLCPVPRYAPDMHRLLVAVALVLVTSAAVLPADNRRFFPLERGSEWTFENLQYGGEETITVARADGGVFRLEGFPGAPSLRVRWLGQTLQAWDTKDRRWEALFRFGAPAGTSYPVDLAQPLWSGVRVTVASRRATVSQPRAAPNVPGHDPVHPAAGSRSGRRGPDRPLVRTGTSGQSAGSSSRSPARSSTSSRAPRTDASQSAVCHDSRSLRRYQRPHRQRRCRRAGTKGGRRWRSNREV